MTIDRLAEGSEAWATLLASERHRRRTAEEEAAHASFLAEASAVLAEGLADYAGLFTRIARLAVPALADWCLVRLCCDGTETTVGLAHVDRDKEALLAPLDLGTLDVAVAEDAAPEGSAPRVEHDGSPARFADCFPGLHGSRRALVIGAAEAAGMRGFAFVPLVTTHPRPLGVLILIAAGGAPRFEPAQMALAQALAARAAVAIDNARLYREARRAALAREDFLVFASHELRTPLASLQLAAQALLRRTHAESPGERPPAWTLPLLGAVERGALRLGSILDDLLDFSYLSGGDPTPVAQEVDLRAVVAESLDRWAEILRRSGCAVASTAEGPTDGCWDRRWLGQIVGHLLSNAAKYGRGAPIAVALQGSEGATRLIVEDHGVGIAAAHQARIFERFERAAPAGQGHGGLGLGLWLVRRMVEGLGGTIAVESAPGEGATFTVDLPRTPRARGRDRGSSPGLASPSSRGRAAATREGQPPSRAMSLRASR